MIGYEDRPERSGEICVFEIFGRNVGTGSTLVGMGVHPFGDLTLEDDFTEVALSFDATQFHHYAVEWTETQVAFFVDRQRVRVVNQSPGYPMQLMLGLYEFAGPEPGGTYPKRFTVDYVRGYRRP
jgi:beta-glucanase (GH16 family)